MVGYSPKKYYIKTYGCSANVADSNTMGGLLESIGFESISLNEKNYKNEREHLMKVLGEVDLLIINSCSVRQKSEDKVYGLGKVFSEFEKDGNKLPFIILCGCMVGSATGDRTRIKKSELTRKTSWADLYISPLDIDNLPEFLKEKGIWGDWVKGKTSRRLNRSLAVGSKHAFVNISNGCDNFCSYCVVPYARGREVSRTQKEILSEINSLLDGGISEITLCGQNVNSWGLSRSQKFKLRAGSGHKLPFAGLLRELYKLDGLKKIDFISSNPFDFTQDLIETLKLPKISNYLHIAVQSGNNDVLKRMNRRHTVEDFLELIKRIKEVRPEIELGTDVIVGFPGETRDQFMDTVRLFDQVPFSVAYIAMYSPRKGTQAEKMYEDNVPVTEKKWRHDYLMKYWRETKK